MYVGKYNINESSNANNVFESVELVESISIPVINGSSVSFFNISVVLWEIVVNFQNFLGSKVLHFWTALLELSTKTQEF